ncbi:MAG: tryptophan synthase subunit alpha [Clostridiaceae bacterium]
MGVSRIEKAFEVLKVENKKAFIPYVMSGDKSLENTKEVIYRLDEMGATVIELGVPFSDPAADGPTIQEAGLKALNNKVTLKAIISMVKEIREKCEVPLILMTYINPVLQYGIDKFGADCKAVGVDGVIIPDLPMEELELVEKALTNNQLAIIPLVAPTTGAERIKELISRGSGFVYTVTVAGVTGARKNLSREVLELLDKVKSISNLPVVAGFGISSQEQINEIKNHCDGVVVGSKIVQLLAEDNFEEIEKLVKSC